MKKGRVTGAKAFVETLESLGVEVIFGYPGGATLPLYDALAHSSIRHVLARHEQGAAHMADGYARSTGKPGVCMATSGPGATNLVTGIATAFMDSSPVIAITGQVPLSMIGNDAFQEVDITGITLPITKHSYLLQKPEEIPVVLEEAFYLASSGRPGPVVIDIPKDIQTMEFTRDAYKRPQLEGYKPTTKGHPGQIKRAAKLLARAERPLIMAGGGSRGAAKALARLSEQGDIPAVTTLMGKASFPNNHANYLGLYGYHGRAAANTAVSEADVILSVGTRFGNRSTGPLERFAPGAEIIHIDIDPAEISKNVPALLPIVGYADSVVEELLTILPEKKRPEWLAKVKALDEDFPLGASARTFSIPAILEKVAPLYEDVIFTTDVGRHQMFAAHHLKPGEEGQFLTSGGLGTMGFGLPAAIGAAMGNPDKPVITISGDGSFTMNCQEMATAADLKTNVTVLVMNDTQLGMIRQLQDTYYGRRHQCCDFAQTLDFAAMAQSMGAEGVQASTVEEVLEALERGVKTQGPTIIDCRIPQGENVYPMVTGNSLTELTHA